MNRDSELMENVIETDPPTPNSSAQQVTKRARSQQSQSNPTEEEEQMRYGDDEPREVLLNRKSAGRGVDAQIEQDRSKLLHVMNTPSADPVELSLEYIEQCIKKDHKLGKGAYGHVFLAEDSHLPKKFVVKMISPTLCDQDTIKEMRKSFQTELSTLKRFRHPNIIVLYGYSLNVDRTMQCMVYEHIANGSVADFFTDDGKRACLSSKVRLSIMFQLVRAVHFLHTGRWKVFHRDIKSANIYVTDNFTPRLIDCGLAKFVQDDSSGVTPEPLPVTLRSTFGGLAFGTPGYMCPEFLRKKGAGLPCPNIAAYDVFSIGVVLVEIILGRICGAQSVQSTRNDSQFLDVFEKYVFDDRTYQRIVDGWKKLKRDADPIIDWNPDALELVSKAAIQCIAPFPEERLTTKDLLDQLSDAIDLNTNAGIQHPQAARAVNSGLRCAICNNNHTDITCRDEGHAMCTICILDKLGYDSGSQLSCLINECSSQLRDKDLYERIPAERYNRFVEKRAERQI